MGEKKPKLSAKDRLCLIQTINALPPTQFDELIFALDPPKGVISSNNAAQGTRSKELLDWLEGSSGPGLAAADEVLQLLIPKATQTAPQPLAFVMMGRMGDLTPGELEAIVELLRQKTGDDSISIAFSREGSIKLILNSSPEGLAKLQEMFESGELEQLGIPPVEAVTPVDTNAQDARKARLIQALSLRNGLLGRDFILDLILALNYARDIELDRTRARTRDIELDRARARDIKLDRARDIALALYLYRARDIALKLACDIDRYIDRARDIALKLARYIDRDRDRALELARYIDIDRALALALTLELSEADLSEADLSGANLKDINLIGADLTGADLTHADVAGTLFGHNRGITEADKRDLQSRGAIFPDPPSSDVPSLVLR